MFDVSLRVGKKEIVHNANVNVKSKCISGVMAGRHTMGGNDTQEGQRI